MILVLDNTASAWDRPKQGDTRISKNSKRRRKNVRTANHPWNETLRQKAKLIASKSVHICLTKSKPDLKSKHLSNKDIVDDN